MNAIPLRANKTVCPHCGAACKTVKTAQLTPVYREVTYVCDNPMCGCVFVASVTPIRILEPSSTPNPDVHLPTREKVTE